ncbi:retrovirus-related pol polyprotein from transposon TNT 1-94 [Tanacetum coccineum]
MKTVIEQKLHPTAKRLSTVVSDFYHALKQEMVEDLKYFKSLENKVKSLQSQLETQKTQFSNEIDRLSKIYYYADHMNTILGVYNKLDEVTNFQCDYLEALEKCQNLKARLQDKNIAISELKKLIVKMKGKSVKSTVWFGNDQFTPILGYGDLLQGNVTIKRVYYVEGLNHNLFSVGSSGTNLYSITLQDTTYPNPIFLMAKASSSQAYWGKLNVSLSRPKLPQAPKDGQLLHMDLCGPMRVESINGNKYVLVIVDDYSSYTWTHFLRSKDKTSEVLIEFLRLVQRGLHAQVRTVRTDKGTKFLNKTLHEYFSKEGIEHQTSVARTLNRTALSKDEIVLLLRLLEQC